MIVLRSLPATALVIVLLLYMTVSSIDLASIRVTGLTSASRS